MKNVRKPRSRSRSERPADRERCHVARAGRRAPSRRGIGIGNIAALNLGIDAAHDAFRHRVRRREHREVDLQHRAKHVVMTMQRRQQLRRGLRQKWLAGVQMLHGADVAARQVGLVWFERHRLAQLAGAHQFGFALDDAEQRAHDIHQVLGELAGIAGRGRLENRRGRLSRLRMLIHVRCPSCDKLARPACCRISVRYTSLEIPTPPALAKDFEYCSVSIERHTPVPTVSPNGPSPLMPLVICENIELRNIASKSVAVALALACACCDSFFSASAYWGSGRPLYIGIMVLAGMLPTWRPITMMPERSSITISAAKSGSTCNSSISVRKATTLPLNSAGIESCAVEGSIGSAVLVPRKSLTAAAMRLAVVKSALRSASRTLGRRVSANLISRSIIGPMANRPTGGTPRGILAGAPFGLEPP